MDVDVDQQAADCGRLCRGDLLDVHAAFGGEEDERLARGHVVQHGGVEFALDLGLLLDQQALDHVIADAHAEDLPGHFLGFIRRAGELDAAGLAALAGRHLRLHHAGPDLGSRHRGFRVADAENAARHRNAGGVQNQRFRGVFLEVHVHRGLVVVMAGLVPAISLREAVPA